MSDNPTISELYKAKIVTETDLGAAVDAYLADLTVKSLAIAHVTVIDPSGAVRASAHATKTLQANVRMELKRDAVRSAFLLAKAKVEEA